MRERLIELLDMDFGFVDEMTAEDLADYLLANGGEVYELTVKNIVYETNAVSFDETAIGVHIFATKEEAERALAERGKDVH